MKNNWFENKLNDRLSQREENIDLNELWADLDAVRNPKKTSRKFLWIPLFGLLIGLSALSFWYISNEASQPAILSATEISLSDHPIVEKVIPTEKELDKETESNKEVSSFDNNKNNSSQNTIKPSANNTTLINNQISNQNLVSSKSYTANQKASINKSKKTNTLTAQSNIPFQPFSAISNIENSNQNNKVNRSTSIKPTLALISSQKATLEKRNAVLGFNSLSLLKSELWWNRSHPVIKSRLGIKMPKQVVINQDFGWTIGFQQTYGIMSRTISNPDDNSNILLKRREFEEKTLDYFNSQIVLQKSLSRHLFFETGIGYSQYTTRSSFNVVSYNTTTQLDTTLIFVDSQGEISAETGPVNTSQKENNKKVRYQKYSSLYIPLQMGIKILDSQKSKINVTGGLAFQFVNLNRGMVGSNYADFEAFEELETAGYSKQINTEALFSINYIRAINDKLSLLGGLNLRYDLSNRLNNSQGFSDKFRSKNLKLGFLLHI